ncbi:MAG: hypothetical protein CVU62_07510 [Deltaproteobacteria bacterium HGW-Deltaproteobacteria-2]|jgi:hypothetical protein|nr:MAG: hypothetical protein CVU62_07510 [Deltaproteobacteria bacterium HGW-Deltaproteobacteria-2]
MKEILEYVSSWSVLKWIVLVLIAGFIGQFGRMAAEAIAGKIRARREKNEVTPNGSTNSSESHSPSISEIPDKKLVKALAKAKKKEAKKKV